jgi:hypothetical protein
MWHVHVSVSACVQRHLTVAFVVDVCRLQPTRALGDFRLKDREFNPAPGVANHIPDPYTPPYIIAEPEVRCLASHALSCLPVW